MASRRVELEIRTKDAEQAIAKLKELGVQGERAFRRITDSAKDVPRSLQAIDAASGDIQGKLKGLTDRLGVVGTALSAIGPAGLVTGAAVAGLGLLGGGFVALVKHAGDAAGAIVDAADAIGIGTENLQALRLAAQEAGVGQEQLDQALQTFTVNAGKAAVGTGSLVKAFKGLDEGFVAAITSATTVEEKLNVVFERLAATTDATERARIAQAAFGEGGAKIANAIGQQGLSVEQLTEKYMALGGVLEDDILRAGDAAADKLALLGTIIETQVNGALLAAAPLIDDVAQSLIDSIPAVLAWMQSWLPQTPLQSLNAINAEIAEVEDQINAVNARAGGRSFFEELFDPAELAQAQGRLAQLRAEQQKLIATIQSGDAVARAAAKERARQIEAEIAGTKRLLEAGKAREKGEKDAAAAAKKSAAEHAQALEQIKKLEEGAAKAGLEGVAKLEAERDQALEQYKERLQEQVISEEEFNRARLAIEQNFQREKEAIEREAAKKREEQARRNAEKVAEIQRREIEKRQEELQRPFVNAAENIQRSFGDTFTEIFREGELSFSNLADAASDIFARLAGELATALIIRPIIQPILGAAQGGGLDFNSILNFGKLSKGVDKLTGGVFNLEETVLDWVGASGLLSEDLGLLAAHGIEFVPASAPLTAAEGQLIFGGDAAQIANFNAGGASAGLSSAAVGGIFAAIIGLLEFANAFADGLRRASHTIELGAGSIKTAGGFFLTLAERNKAITSAINDVPIVGLVNKLAGGPLFGKLITGQKSFGDEFGTLAGDRLSITKEILAALVPFGLGNLFTHGGLLGVFQPPTKGTVLRQGFEEFIESAVDIFKDNSFRRNIGQSFARDFANSGQGDFAEGLRTFARDTGREKLGLSDAQLNQFQGLATAFRAFAGAAFGDEEQRSVALFASIVGNLAEKGVDADAAMEALGQAIGGLGPPSTVFNKLNEFFTSPENDIAVEDYRLAIQGLAEAIFNNVPTGVRVAEVALEELNKTGTVTFDTLKLRVLDLSNAAELLLPAFQELAQAVAADPLSFFEGAAFPVDLTSHSGTIDISLVNPDKIQEFHDAVLIAMRDAVLQGFVQATLQATLQPTVLEPFTRGTREILEKINTGEISPNEGAQLIAKLGRQAAASLAELDPAIRQFVIDMATLADAFPEIGDAALDAADDMKTAAEAFDAEIQRLILAIEDPERLTVANLERQQRQRLENAITLGANIVEVERLNALEREQLLKDLGEDETRQLEQLADQRERIFERQREQAQQALDAIEDVIIGLRAGPNSPLAPQVLLPAARERFEDLLEQARGGDLEAARELPAAFQDLLAIARELFASSPEFFAIFESGLDDLEDVLGAGIDIFATNLSPGDQAIVDEIDAQTAELTAALAHIADLIAQGSGLEEGGAFGLTASNQALLKQTLSELGPSSPAVQTLQDLLALETFEELQGLDPKSRQGIFFKQLQELFPQADTIAEFDAVVQAIIDKILHPGTVQPLLGFARGGIVTEPTLGLIGEAGRAEAVLPLDVLARMLRAGEVVEGITTLQELVRGGDDQIRDALLALDLERVLRAEITSPQLTVVSDLLDGIGRELVRGHAQLIFLLTRLLDEHRGQRDQMLAMASELARLMAVL